MMFGAKRYKILGSGASTYEIGEYNDIGVLAQIYTAFFDDKSATFTLYPKRGGWRSPGADVRKKKIHMSEVAS